MAERWKQIPGFEGLYEASSLGRVRTAPGKTTSNARFPVRVWKTRVLKEKMPMSAPRHDSRVTLWKNGQSSDHLVARLVAAAWHGNPQPGMTVNHINGDYMDNRPANLEWVTLADNIKYGFESGQYASICVKTILYDNVGNEYDFRSMAEASRFLGRCENYMSNAVGRGRTVLRSQSGDEFTFKADRGG